MNHVKTLLLLIAIAAGGYYVYNEHFSVTAITVDSYQALLKKAEATSVSLDEVKVGANNLTAFICSDPSYQVTGGSTPANCMARYENYREMCENRIFGQSPQSFASKSEVIAIAKRYTSCVGAVGS